MPRPRYQLAEQDVPAVHRWVHAKFHDTARAARSQFPREQPTAAQLQLCVIGTLMRLRGAVAGADGSSLDEPEWC
jgi:hypothetical protein